MQRPLSLLLSACSLVLLAPSAFAQAPTADYEITFDATWSAATHPSSYPTNAHFSPLVGGTHDANVSFWGPGAIASNGIELMAELGLSTPLQDEIDVEILNGFADQTLFGFPPHGPGQVTMTITVDHDYPLLTLVTMLAPSPDWFLGVHDLDLTIDGWWLPELDVDLLPYDAGTDYGPDFDSANDDTDPHEPIALLGAPFTSGVPLGTFQIRRLPEPGLAIGLAAGLLALAARTRHPSH